MNKIAPISHFHRGPIPLDKKESELARIHEDSLQSDGKWKDQDLISNNPKVDGLTITYLNEANKVVLIDVFCWIGNNKIDSIKIEIFSTLLQRIG